MNRFLREFITQWRWLELPFEGEIFVAAVSGGADSVALLLALHQLKQKNKLRSEIVVAHFNHALRGKESDRDEAFVRKLSGKLGLKFESGEWKTKKPATANGANAANKENLEQAARNARYEFLESVAGKYKAYGVLTGHTLDDQAETFLLRLIRGSGVDGLGAMKPVRGLGRDKNILLIRPLLGWARRTGTEELCRLEKVKYRNDSMNKDKAFLRVRIRREVLPLLQNINPQIVTNLAKMSGVFQAEGEELGLAARAGLFAVHDVNNDTLDLKGLMGFSSGMRRRVLRLWLENLRGGLRALDMKHFAALERLVLSAAGGKTVELPGGERVSIRRGRLIFKKTKVEKSPPDN
ncbi:MAG TPA: tRNA lysidine(34) synthetase TilS [Pyrinomonadaceae bacterium]|jgi:tRNA(Ile)-lysidine synthase|nr:tRNA lysidine(34) synthetase TilS [Pyrinomonadaceae bacterium]